METPIYEKTLEKKAPFGKIKKSIFYQDLKEILREYLSFYKESSKVPRKLDKLL